VAGQVSVVIAKPLKEDSAPTIRFPPPKQHQLQPAFAGIADMIERRGKREGRMFIRTRDSHFRSMVKAVSWRITGSIDIFVLSFIFTGSVKVAGSIAGAEAITKMILYYLHERAWSVIRWNQQGQTGGGPSSP